MRRVGLRGLALGLALACAGTLATGCGTSARAVHGDTVELLYAGSLVSLMQQQLAPAFTAATDDHVSGFPAGSAALATQIRGKVRQGDVFISASPGVNDSLRGARNGGWVSWYGTFATSRLVLGYNPKSRFAAALRSEPWYRVVTEPGFRLGLTDPATDPKGTLSVQALTDTARRRNAPALASIATDRSAFYPEETLVGRLQAGQLDAGFFYASEASAAGLETVPLTGADLQARYTVTILNRAPHERAAEAFVSYLLGPSGRRVLARNGFTVVSPPVVTGTGVPAGLSAMLPGR